MWCTSVVIDALEEDATWWPEIRPMHEDALGGKLEILISEVTVAEACKLTKVRTGGKSVTEVRQLLRDFFDNDWILRRPADRRECELAAQFINDTEIECCDAIIAATAIIHGAEALYSRDGLKKRRAKQKSLLRMNGLLAHPDRPNDTLSIKAPDAAEYQGHPLFAKTDDDKDE